MRIGLIGTGYWGAKLLRNLVALVGVDDVVVVDHHVDRLAEAVGAYPSVRTYRSLDEALDKTDIEAVVIATPVSTHAPLAARALAAGRHVLVEKPLTMSLAEADQVVELAEHRGLVLMVGHTFLFSPRVRWIADFVREGRLGELHYMTSSRLNLGLHRIDSNVIWDLAPHDISVLIHLIGETPTTVTTAARSIVRKEVPDVAFMDFTFDSGLIASITVSWFAPRKIRSVMLVGDARMLVYDDTDSEEPVKVHDRGVVLEESSDFGLHQLTYRYGDTLAPHIEVTEPLAGQLASFINVIEGRESALSDGRFGRAVVASLEAADASWRSGGVPVEVPIPDRSLVR
jgi:predicted dehydrogenase